MVKWVVKINERTCTALTRTFPKLLPHGDYGKTLLNIIDNFIEKREFTHVLEVGGIDRPLLRKSPAIRLEGLDIEFKEDCGKIYDNFLVQSIEKPISRKYDLIISKTLLEHVRNNSTGLKSCYGALKQGGTMIHYLPSKWHPYSIILRLIGPRLQKLFIALFRPHALAKTGYPAYFDHCSPAAMKHVLTDIGFIKISIKPFYNAADYFSFCFPLYTIVLLWEHFCRKLGWAQFCSGFIFVAEKS